MPIPGDGGGTPKPTPAERRWHKAFDSRNCEAIAALGPARDQRQLYAGLGDACRAAIRHDDQRWLSAQSALQQVDDPDTCLDRSALRLLRDLVGAHLRNPDAGIRIVDAQGETRCDDPPSISPTPGTSRTSAAPAPSAPPAGSAGPPAPQDEGHHDE